jgi:hypothetical protein
LIIFGYCGHIALCLEIFGVLQLDINLDSVEWNLSGINELLERLITLET